MVKNSSIFNFKKLPGGFIFFLVMALIFEVSCFSKAYLLANRSVLCVVYKNMVMHSHRSADVVILGWSRALAIDAKSLERSLDGKLTVYNYALPNLGTKLQLYLVLKKYLFFCKRPKLIIASQPIEAFYDTSEDNGKGDGIFINPGQFEVERFRRFISFFSLLRDVPFNQAYSLLSEYAKGVIPSADYSFFIRSFLKQSLKKKGKITSGGNEIISGREKLIKEMQSTNGQLLFNKDTVVSDEGIKNSLPKNPLTKSVKDFERFVALCDQNGIRTVFILMPIERTRYENMRRLGWFDDINERMERLGKRYKNFEYFKISDLDYLVALRLWI